MGSDDGEAAGRGGDLAREETHRAAVRGDRLRSIAIDEVDVGSADGEPQDASVARRQQCGAPTLDGNAYDLLIVATGRDVVQKDIRRGQERLDVLRQIRLGIGEIGQYRGRPALDRDLQQRVPHDEVHAHRVDREGRRRRDFDSARLRGQGPVSWEGHSLDPFAASVDALFDRARAEAHVPSGDELTEYARVFYAGVDLC